MAQLALVNCVYTLKKHNLFFCKGTKLTDTMQYLKNVILKKQHLQNIIIQGDAW